MPERLMSAAEIAEKTGIPEDVIAHKFGVKHKPVPGPADTPSYMGLKAARRALDQAGVDPADVAKSMMLTKDELNRVLLVSGYRNVDLIDLSVKETSFMADIGASGAAVLLEKGYDRNVILGSSFRGDGSFAEDCVVPVLGAKAWTPKEEDAKRAYFEVRDVESFKRKLGERTLPNFFHVIRESLQRSGGLTEEDIDYLAILHFKRSAHDEVLRELGLDEGRTTYLDEYGHLGQNDQVLSVELGLKDGKIHDGDTVVMVGAGLGFVWASSVVRWGAQQET
ncbi:MAG: 3-oxoacyl-[acyl-carrier-protein] synthase III C-terminal domain-containing protein [Spirochaetaceae bacterium]